MNVHYFPNAPCILQVNHRFINGQINNINSNTRISEERMLSQAVLTFMDFQQDKNYSIYILD